MESLNFAGWFVTLIYEFSELDGSANVSLADVS
jgi:hypothetical protein